MEKHFSFGPKRSMLTGFSSQPVVAQRSNGAAREPLTG
jgi:hypothetical protein